MEKLQPMANATPEANLLRAAPEFSIKADSKIFTMLTQGSIDAQAQNILRKWLGLR